MDDAISTTNSPFLILTSGRSGSRLLAEIFHRSGVPVLHGDLRDNRGLLYECEELNLRQAFIDKVRYDPGFDYSMLRAFEAETTELSAWLRKNIRTIEGPGPVVKDPRILHLVPVYREVFPHARFIHLVRDGRDYAISKNEELAFWRQPRRRPRELLEIWQARMELLEPFRGAEWFHELRFEDLLAEPAIALDELWSFLNLSIQPVLPQLDLTRRARHAQEPVRFPDLDSFEFLRRFEYC